MFIYLKTWRKVTTKIKVWQQDDDVVVKIIKDFGWLGSKVMLLSYHRVHIRFLPLQWDLSPEENNSIFYMDCRPHWSRSIVLASRPYFTGWNPEVIREGLKNFGSQIWISPDLLKNLKPDKILLLSMLYISWSMDLLKITYVRFINCHFHSFRSSVSCFSYQ